MNARFFILVALLGSATAACSDSAGSCTQTQGTTTFCAEYGGDVSSDNAQSSCSAGRGTYSSGSCSSTNRVGRCATTTSSGGTTITSTVSLYAPLTDAEARQFCSLLRGTYTSG